MRQPLELIAVGLDHRTAGIELRERVAFAAAEIPRALEKLTDRDNRVLEQAAILSTCNRVEVYGIAPWSPVTEVLQAFIAKFHGLEPHELAGAMYVHRSSAVPDYLAATAAGMHSLVLGEAQIQGQVRAALEQALEAGSAGPELRRLFETAITAGRRARSRTGIGRGVASVPHAGVELARERLGTLRGSTAMVIGAGTTAELAAKHLVKHGARELLVLGRDAGRAERLASRYGGRVVTSHRLAEALARSDVVITATSSPRPVLQRKEVEWALTRRRQTSSSPLVVVDLAVPRDVDPVVAGLDGVEVHTTDDLRQVVERTLARRRRELPAANAIVRAEVARFSRWLSHRETAVALDPTPATAA
jgi:glutamyl-tRNA reductase